VFSASGAVVVDGTLELNSTASFLGTLSGTGLIDCDANVTLQAASTLAPSFHFAQNVTVYSSAFAPTTGCVVFDGTSTQTVTQASGAPEIVFACLEIEQQSSVTFLDDLHVTGATLWNGEGTTSGDAQFDGSFEGTDVGALLLTGASKNVEWKGGVIAYAGFLEPGGIIYITTSGSVMVDVPNGFGVLVNVGITGTLTIENATLALGGDLVIQSGTVVGAGDLALTIASPHSVVIEAGGVLDAQGNRLQIVDDAPLAGVPITVEGRLEVGAGGELALAASTIDVQSGGVLSIVGFGPDSRAGILGAPLTGGGWQVEIGAGATLEAQFFQVQQMGTGGIDVDIGASLGAFPLDVRDGIFDRIAANGVYLEIDRSSPTQLDDLQFLDSSGVGHANQPGTKNVRVSAASQIVSFEGWSGSFGGPQFEDDATGLALWGSRLDYLIVRERLTRNDVFWRTVFEDDVLSFHVERAPDLGGSFVQIG